MTDDRGNFTLIGFAMIGAVILTFMVLVMVLRDRLATRGARSTGDDSSKEPVIKFGNRKDWERGLKLLFIIPGIVIFAPVAAGILKAKAPPMALFALGGAVGGGVGYILGTLAVLLMRALIGPPAPEDKT